MTITDTCKLYLAIVALSHPQKSKAASTSSKTARARRDKDVVANVGSNSELVSDLGVTVTWATLIIGTAEGEPTTVIDTLVVGYADCAC